MSYDLGTKLKQYRVKSNLTQSDLGKLLFVSPQSVSKWEKGESSPSIDTFVKICELLEISPNEILEFNTVTNYIKPEDKIVINKNDIIKKSIRSLIIGIIFFGFGALMYYLLDVYGFRYFDYVGFFIWGIGCLQLIYVFISNLLEIKKVSEKTEIVDTLHKFSLIYNLFYFGIIVSSSLLMNFIVKTIEFIKIIGSDYFWYLLKSFFLRSTILFIAIVITYFLLKVLLQRFLIQPSKFSSQAK